MEERNLESQKGTEVSLWDIFNILWNKAGIILFSGIFFLLASFLVTKMFITPQYESITKMYVMTQQDNSILTQGDMQTSTYLTKDYAEMIKSRTVTEQVISKLGLNISSGGLLKKIKIQISTDTRVINISVRDKEPYVAAGIANEMREIASKHIENVMNIEAVNVVEVANIPKQAASPNVMKNTLMGGMIGTFIVMAIILISHLVNDTIQISDDIEKYLDMNVLSVIPVKEGKKTKRRKKKVKKRT